MRILFFTHYFPPEVNAPASRTFEHCREWVKAGHDVHVVTCVPSHPHGRPFPGFRRAWYRRDEVEGIHVHRVWTHMAPNRAVLRRALNFVSFVPTAVLRAWRLGRFDVVIGTSPQFFCAVATWIYARTSRTPWVFEVRDLWPESIAAVGAMRPSIALRLLERLALRMYRDAAAVVCVTNSFIRILRSRGVDGRKLHFVPNGIDPPFWQRADREAERSALGVAADEVLACYVGTVGMAHGVGTVLEAARLLRERQPSVRVLIVGDGAELQRMRTIARRDALTNVTFSGLVPRERVPGILAATDIALVTLTAADLFKTVLPSKMFEAMAAGAPIVLAVDGEARETLERADAGVPVPPGDARALADAIARLAGDARERTRMGAAGAAFVEQAFNRRRWAKHYAGVLSRLSPAHATPALADRQLVMRNPRG